jgi:hypothetical protein
MSKKEQVGRGKAKAVVLGLSSLLLAPPAHAVNTNVLIQARILTTGAPLVSVTRSMDFGILAYTTSGAIAIDDNDTLQPAVPVGSITGVGGTPSSGGLSIMGDAGRSVVISAPTGSVTITSGANTMKVNSFTVDGETVSPSVATRTIPGTVGVSTLSGVGIGGTLNVGAAQATGTYTGSFNVAVNYL